MRIGINALYLLPGKVGGTEIYIRSLVRWLARIDRENEYFIFINRESAGVFEELAPSMEIVQCPVQAENRILRLLWEQFMLPFQARSRKLDVLFSAGMTCPFVCHAASVLVIHDLQHVNQPGNFAWYYLPFLRFFIYMSARRADEVVAISEHVKRQVEEKYGIEPPRVHTVYNAMDSDRFYRRDSAEVSKVREKYGLPDRFVLYAASTLPHKNHARLLDAFRLVREREKRIKLVLVGTRGAGREDVRARIRELGLEDAVLFLGWLPFEDVPVVYSASEVFVFPSLHEGFGIPLVEAMAAGVPVVCSGIEPLMEVAGDAACFVDPLDAEDMASGMLRVLEDRGYREGLVEKGFKRVKKFSWEETARETLSVLTSAGGRA